LFLILSYAKVLLGRTGFDMKLHLELQQKYNFFSGKYDTPSIEVFLPCCGESIFVLENTYKFVQKLRWSAGKLNVHVLEDRYSDEVQQLAAAFGFNYICRPDHPHLKKAGNLHNAFKQTSSKFILVLDADFTPRTDFLTETVPYVVNDPEIAILQTPQFFRILKCQTWIQKGAGSVQELFYRLIQQYRNLYGAAICVGTSALYQRAALAPFGGTAAVEHSEDMRTGFINNLKSYNIAFPLPSVCGGMLAQFIWARQRYGLYTLRVQIISAYSHVMALKDAVFNTRMQWIPTGGAKSQSSKAGKAAHNVPAALIQQLCMRQHDLTALPVTSINDSGFKLAFGVDDSPAKPELFTPPTNEFATAAARKNQRQGTADLFSPLAENS
ncbi:hypothetical protein HDU82_003582, partial [Entophlyctis luteolus]